MIDYNLLKNTYCIKTSRNGMLFKILERIHKGFQSKILPGRFNCHTIAGNHTPGLQFSSKVFPNLILPSPKSCWIKPGTEKLTSFEGPSQVTVEHRFLCG
ncbi:hypothetical protein OUZ56_009591 [Daphnia magna]|uniref:GMP synthase n=1 Tax=Daphnia magna TaxID=35525 RepID=A0ABR0AGE2_9CRUS|nr:hypothetical protein OUZ56_009587 [Daphnia magna]KAK4024202.1 hypothetical protein OUZ56_009589 [Daphnia magna]KAK4024204.1 hypothetical protein OUZ56_009591 [Daphnia magna]